MVHTVCLLLDCRKRKISATIFLLSNSEENLSSFLLLPGNSLLLKSLLHSLQISWLISCSEMPSPIHRLRKKKVQPLPEASSRAGLGSPGTKPTAGAQKDQVRLWCRQLPLACESLWELTVGETQNHWHSKSIQDAHIARGETTDWSTRSPRLRGHEITAVFGESFQP